MDKRSSSAGTDIDRIDWGCPICRSTCTTSAGPRRPSSASTANRARAGCPYLLKSSTGSTCRAGSRSSSARSSQRRTDAEGGELSAAQLWEMFQDECLLHPDPHQRWGASPRSARRSRAPTRAPTSSSRSPTAATRWLSPAPATARSTPSSQALDPLGDRRADSRLHRARPVCRRRRAPQPSSDALVGERVLWGVGLHESIVRSASIRASSRRSAAAERDIAKAGGASHTISRPAAVPDRPQAATREGVDLVDGQGGAFLHAHVEDGLEVLGSRMPR